VVKEREVGGGKEIAVCTRSRSVKPSGALSVARLPISVSSKGKGGLPGVSKGGVHGCICFRRKPGSIIGQVGLPGRGGTGGREEKSARVTGSAQSSKESSQGKKNHIYV